MGESGGSAERKAAELAAAGDATAGAWAAGAEGERLTAEALKGLGPTWVVLHDRLLFPGVTDSNVDHVVLGPGGIFVIDTKNRAGDISVYENGLYQHMFSASGDRVTKSMQGELGKVTWTAQEMSKRLGVTVVPVICLAGARSKNQKGVNFVQDVTVVGVQQLVGWLRAQAPRMPARALAAWATRVMTEFPSTTTDPELLGAMAPAMRQHYLDRGHASGAGASTPRQARGSRPRRRPTRPRRPANAHPASVVPRAPSPTTTRPKSERSPRQRGSCLRPLLQAMAGVAAAACVLAFHQQIGEFLSRTLFSQIARVSSAAAGGPASGTRTVACSTIATADLPGMSNSKLDAQPKPGCSWSIPLPGDASGFAHVEYLTSDAVEVYASSATRTARETGKSQVTQSTGTQGVTTIHAGKGNSIVGSAAHTLGYDARVTVQHGALGLDEVQGLALANALLVRSDQATTGSH